jgi:hypothetical protein
MSYFAVLSLERVFSQLVVTLPEMVEEKPQTLRLDSMEPSLVSLSLSAAESLTSIVKFTVASSIVKAGTGTRASSGAFHLHLHRLRLAARCVDDHAVEFELDRPGLDRFGLREVRHRLEGKPKQLVEIYVAQFGLAPCDFDERLADQQADRQTGKAIGYRHVILLSYIRVWSAC